MAMKFTEWLENRDPELSEVLGLSTLGKAAGAVGRAGKWAVNTGIPLAVNTALVMNDPISIAMSKLQPPTQERRPQSDNQKLGVNIDDYVSARDERARRKRREEAEMAALDSGNKGKGPTEFAKKG